MLKNNIQSIYDKTIKLSSNKKSWKVISIISFFESIIFPIPTDLFLIPMIIADKSKALFLILVAVIFSVAGGVLGYIIGFFFWETVSQYFYILYPSFEINFNNFKNIFNSYGWLFVLIGGFTPFPYKIITISSGILELNIFLFIIFSLISRFMRFFLVGFIIFKYGESTKKVIDKYFNAITLITIILIICYFFLKDEI